MKLFKLGTGVVLQIILPLLDLLHGDLKLRQFISELLFVLLGCGHLLGKLIWIAGCIGLVVQSFQLTLKLSQLTVSELLIGLGFTEFLIGLGSFILQSSQRLLIAPPCLFQLRYFLFQLTGSLLLYLQLLFHLFNHLLLA